MRAEVQYVAGKSPFEKMLLTHNLLFKFTVFT